VLFDQFTRELPHHPQFHRRLHDDVNPLGGYEKKRWIYAPNKAMRLVHKRFMRFLMRRPPQMPFSTCGMRGNSPRKNVIRHRNAHHLFVTDLTGAYQHADLYGMVEALIIHYPELDGMIEETAAFLSRYCMLPNNGGLVTGSPSSVFLFNLFCHTMIDQELDRHCRKPGFFYSRYLDDLIFSCHHREIGPRYRQSLRRIIEANYFLTNHSKSRVIDLRLGPVNLNGLKLELGGRIFLPRDYLGHIRGSIHLARTQGGVTSDQINGMMGVFWPSVVGRKPNATEQKLIDQYRAYRKWLSQGGQLPVRPRPDPEQLPLFT